MVIMTIKQHLLVDAMYFIIGIFLCLQGRKYWNNWKESLGITCWDECQHPLDCWSIHFLKAILAYGAGLSLSILSICLIIARFITLTGP